MRRTEGYGRDPSNSPRARAQNRRDRPRSLSPRSSLAQALAAQLNDTSTTLSEGHALQLLATQSEWLHTLKQS